MLTRMFVMSYRGYAFRQKGKSSVQYFNFSAPLFSTFHVGHNLAYRKSSGRTILRDALPKGWIVC